MQKPRNTRPAEPAQAGVDWEQRRWEAMLAALPAVVRQCAADLPMQPSGTVPEEYFASKAVSIADALLAAAKEAGQ